jgi:hypothetical protein
MESESGSLNTSSKHLVAGRGIEAAVHSQGNRDLMGAVMVTNQPHHHKPVAAVQT